MKINMEDVKKLREQTACGMVDCKEALEESKGDFQKAVEILRKKGKATAEKKASRATGEGVVEAYIHGTGKIGVLLEVACETDFVAKNEQFKEFAHEVALHIAAAGPSTVEELLGQPYVKDESRTIEDLLTDLIGKTGENAKVVRFARFAVGETS